MGAVYGFVKLIYRNRFLIKTLTKRDIHSRYDGSVLGIVWLFVSPIMMLAIYTFVFSSVLKVRWEGAPEGNVGFALVLYSGLAVHIMFAEAVTRACGLITSNVSYVKRVIFPLEVLPLVNLISSLFYLAAGLSVWLIFYVISLGTPKLIILLVPVALFPLALIVLGVSLFVSSLSVYVRDTTQFVVIINAVLLFLSPIFYPVSALPDYLQTIIFVNPLAQVVESMRDLMIWGKVTDAYRLIFLYLYSATIACAGVVWFQKTKRGFADVL